MHDADKESEKVNFRSCIEADCVPLATQLATRNAAASALTRFSVRRTGDNANAGGFDPVRGEPARLRSIAAEDLLACERACAQKFWPSVERKPWIGTVALEIAGVSGNQLGGLR